ncbi:MAG: ATP-dependent zinc metalloprotease FtsH [Patescibacteria group bacterium]|nr:ATP-dependent zinc metalloprotease FtsH [Patescibacteria group bacterium]
MKSLAKNILITLLIIFSLALAASLVYQTSSQPKNLNLSTLASDIESGQIKSINVSGNSLTITGVNGQVYQGQKEAESGIVETLKNYGVTPEELAKVNISVASTSGSDFWINVVLPIILPTIVMVFIFYYLLRQTKQGVNQAFNFGRANLRLFTSFKDRITFADVAGLKEVKEEMLEIVDFLKNPKKYLDIGAKIPRGVLLIGPPGSGKTLLARAVAGEANVPFFHISASEFVEMFVGVGAARTRDAFATAKRAAPSILFIDEIDAVGRERGAGLGGGHDEREQTLNQILVEMDGFDRNTQVIVLAATNRPDILDPALLRPGRFDRRIMLDFPDIGEREAILKIHAKGKPLDTDVDFRRVAVRTPGFSGADLANLVNEAAILAVQQGKASISQQNLYDSIEKVLLGPARKSRVIPEKEREITAYHEAGHALVAAGLKNSDPVHKVSIVSRGMAGGYTIKLPLEEHRLTTKSQFLSELAMMMGGYAAEEERFGDITTGASNDLKEASNTARMIVTRFGMSDLGPITFGKTEELLFLGKEITTEKNYSEATAEKIDGEVSGLLTKAHKTARKIVSAHKDVLDKVAKALLEKETLEGEEFYALIKDFDLQPIEA